MNPLTTTCEPRSTDSELSIESTKNEIEKCADSEHNANFLDQTLVRYFVRQSLKRTFEFFLYASDKHLYKNLFSSKKMMRFKLQNEFKSLNISPEFSDRPLTKAKKSQLLDYDSTMLNEKKDTKQLFPRKDVRPIASVVQDNKNLISHIDTKSSNVLYPQHDTTKSIVSHSNLAVETVKVPQQLAQATKTSISSTALNHLTFRRPTIIPQATKHPEWELFRVISGHQGWVRTLSVDPTNEWFASGGNDRLIKIWDLATGTLKLSLTGHINTIRSVIVSTRHPYLFSCGEDQMVKCWDLEYNKVIRHYHGHLSGVYSMALHPSLDILSSGGRDAVVRLWDIRTKLAIHILSGHSSTVMSLLHQQHEPQLISGSLDKMIRCWDIVAGKTSVVLTHHKKAIRSLAAHSTEYTFCSAGADHLKVWKCPKAQFERNLESVHTIINSIAIRNNFENNSIVIGGSDQGHLYFWDWMSGRKFQTIESTPQPGSLSSEKAIYAVCLDMSESRLLTAECDKTIKIWREKQPE